ncbi:MAG: T9SS type A sorting domain-containing protein [Rhodothermaceae bacterium]|nr:T9SS type A sorting domain-containing protein [Rhodothermaceae bacterium]
MLPDGIFDELTSLTGLSLSANDLSTLPDGIFDRLSELSLENLSLGANPGAPFRPVVNAGTDLTVQPGAAVSISGSVTGPWVDFVRWDWIQVDGPDSDTPISGALSLTGGDTAKPSFMVPTAEGELYFKLVVAPGHRGNPNEYYGHAYSNPDWVTVTVTNTPINTSETPSVVDFNLLGNYPNPFNPSTTILLDIPQVAAVTVDVFNMLGQRVHREEFPAVAAGASKPLPLDVSHLSSGAYIYQVTARIGKEVHRAGGRMTLIK